MTPAAEGAMAQGMSSGLGDCWNSGDSRVAAAGATIFKLRGSAMAAGTPARPRWDLLGAAEGACGCDLKKLYEDWITRVVPLEIP